ncbi:hypothetical protein HYH02_010775 [Chlamydomonas schloesseri]|uniref:DRBM domain-containing protein n=1 Tax=Chlamydomonas schloesseri TaxID=2026947 RepID=A0A835T576_9CHLO|nr:hypothetical protein HYH02_010775 [Chlamydomonas schloesseri]|eukprot:KAG2438983.1 hypothetical protein HYH02_010775 [Chlamydomonas schloesseri]
MAAREFGAAIFSPGLSEVLLYQHSEQDGWAFPFGFTNESDVHVVAAAAAVQHLIGVDIGDKISRGHWIEVEYPATGALVRLYVALGVRPESTGPRPQVEGATARWFPLRAILPPVNAILRGSGANGASVASGGAGGGSRKRHHQQGQGQGGPAARGAGGRGGPGGPGKRDEGDEDEEDAAEEEDEEAEAEEEEAQGGELLLEPGIAPFLAKLKALLDKHPEWRMAQLDPHLTRLIQDALAPLATAGQSAPVAPLDQLRLASAAAAPEPPAAGKGAAAAAAGLDAAAAAAGATQQPTTAAAKGQETSGPKGAAAQAGSGVKLEPVDDESTPGPLLGALALADRPEPSPKPVEDGAQGAGGSAADVRKAGHDAEKGAAASGQLGQAGAGAAVPELRDAGPGAGCEQAGTAAGSGGAAALPAAEAGGWCGPRPQEHLAEYCRMFELPEPCYSLVVKKSARRPLVTASCILPHLGVQITPDMHVPGGMQAACQAAALAAMLWLEGALPPDGGESVRVVPVGWPPLLSEARGESWEASQLARRAGARRELDSQREALLREMDKKRQRLVAEAAELERLMAALRGGEGADGLGLGLAEPDLSRLTASLGLGGSGSGGAGGGAPAGGAGAAGADGPQADAGATAGDGGGGAGGLAGSVTVGLRALQFRSSGSGANGAGTAGGSGSGGAAGGSRAPGTKRPREDGGGGTTGGSPGPGDTGGGMVKNVVMELKELCDRKRWPQPQYNYTSGAGAAGGGSAGATAVVTLPAQAGLGEFSSGPQTNRKRAKEAAAAAALAQLSALGLK